MIIYVNNYDTYGSLSFSKVLYLQRKENNKNDKEIIRRLMPISYALFVDNCDNSTKSHAVQKTNENLDKMTQTNMKNII